MDVQVFTKFAQNTPTVGVIGSSGNLQGFTALTTGLVVPRRAHVMLSAGTTSQNRYVYAFGGDQDTTGNPVVPVSILNSVEYSQMDLNGNLNPFALLSQQLPVPLTQASGSVIAVTFIL